MNDDSILLNCPHCQQFFFVQKEEIKCAIFRHGIYIHNLEPIDPHLSKQKCQELVEQNKIYGCGKPFQMVMDSSGKNFYTQVCDYI
jgi:hypothetical protein